MFEIECKNCGNKGCIKEEPLNINENGEQLDCFTHILSEKGRFRLHTTKVGFTIQCSECGQSVSEYNSPY